MRWRRQEVDKRAKGYSIHLKPGMVLTIADDLHCERLIIERNAVLRTQGYVVHITKELKVLGTIDTTLRPLEQQDPPMADPGGLITLEFNTVDVPPPPAPDPSSDPGIDSRYT